MTPAINQLRVIDNRRFVLVLGLLLWSCLLLLGCSSAQAQSTGDAQDSASQTTSDEKPSGEPEIKPSSVGFGDLLPKPKKRSLAQWAKELQSDRYRTRKIARQKLVEGGYDSIPALKQLLDEGELDSTETVIQILSLIAEDEPPWQSDGAIATLESISKSGFGTKATIAKSVLKSFSESRDAKAREELAKIGVIVGVETVALGSRSRPQNLIRIDSNWNGSVRELAWIRWLKNTPYAIIEGNAIRPEVLDSVIRLQSDMTLILMEGELTASSLEVLSKRDRIDAIEIRYVRLSESLLKKFPSINIRQALHLMGTGTQPEQVDELRAELPGVVITARSGGFLGVICRSLDEDYCEVNEVIRGSGAAEAGIQPGDIVIRIDDAKITRFDDLQRQINTHIPGDEIEIEIRRHRQIITTTAVLKKLETQ
ncbi:PDZ domain-containing protein [Stieleria sp. JC731]|uniref:PDZ domain-containing protein n=1 Tax=Pirellulaceae TaxID=2691357 RepID=UPI001E43C5B8|nr:PDZ domain-containing protein [Stieleria sp. JC731]MCC9603282.1 PDZ domain-containing protein [Stieleria sp. JC731]